MGENSDFSQLVSRLRRGDDAAAQALVDRYGEHIRRVVRIRLSEPALRRQFDSMDICQSVLGEFFVQAALGAFDLESPDQLVALLATMARNKLQDYVRRHHAQRRNVGRVHGGGIEDLPLASLSPTPSAVFAGRELLDRFRGMLSPSERHLAEQRAAGKSWAELAAELSQDKDALRMQFSRAIKRAATHLGLEGFADDVA